jgi:hypothetical protein
MTSVAPPTEFFPGIDFNPSFYNLGQSAVTLDYLNSNFLRSTGYAISRAQFTLFNGTVDINENLDVSGNINASAYLLNGVPFTPSQWTTSVNDIYYTTGNVGIGKTNPTYKLDVSGNINCNAIFRSGTELTQYTDANVRTVLGTSAGTNMTWNTGTNKFDVAAPYTDTNVRTVLSTSAGTNMTWNTGTNKFDVSVVFPPSYTDTNVRTVLSNSAGTNMTWNTGTNKFDVAAPYTLPTAGTGSGGTLGGVKVDGTTISINASTGVISRTGNTILLNVTTTGEYYGWTGLSSGLFRVGTNGQYSTGSLVEDIVLRSNGDVLLQSGIGNYGMRINTSNNILMRNAVGVGSTAIAAGFNLDVTGNVTMRNAACIGSTTITSGFALDITGNVAMRTGLVVGGTAITSGYTLDVKGDVITSGNINFANTSRSIFWGGSNSSLARAGVAGQYSSSSLVEDIILRSGNRLLLQSGTGVAGMVINTDNNVFIGASTNSSDDGNVNIAIPDSTFYVRGPRTIGGTTNISFRGGLEGNNNGKVRIWMSSDAAHSSYIESHHTGNGFTTLSFGTSGGNALPTERMRILYNGSVGIQDSTTSYATLNNHMAAGSLTIGNTTQNYGGGNVWNTNTAGLLLECADATEIAVHDAGTAIHSFMYYSGGIFQIGRNMGYNSANVNIKGWLAVDRFISATTQIVSGSYILSSSRIYSRNGGYDTWIYSDSGGMYLSMGNQSTENAPTYFRMGAYSGATYYESNQGRSHRFWCYGGTFNGTIADWSFNASGSAFNAINSGSWNTFSDHRIKENIVKADLKTCYDNVKNINLYRFNYIDSFRTASTDKNKLGYIAQEVKRHFPKATSRKKERLTDNREIPDLLSIDTEQINISLYGAVKQLIKIVEKQDKRIKTLESLLNIEDNNDVEDDAGEEYVKIYDEEECDIDDIEPTEPSNEV